MEGLERLVGRLILCRLPEADGPSLGGARDAKVDIEYLLSGMGEVLYCWREVSIWSSN